MTSIIPTNTYGLVKYVVSSNIGQGNFTSIQAALNAASAGETVYIADGTYNENVNLKPNVSITALNPSGYSNNVILSGQYTYGGNGTVTIGNVTFNSSSSQSITFNGTTKGTLNLIYCGFLQGSNNVITFTNFNAESSITLQNCIGIIQTNTSSFIFTQAPGNLALVSSYLAGNTINYNPSQFSETNITLKDCIIEAGFTLTDATITVNESEIYSITTAFNLNNSTAKFYNSTIFANINELLYSAFVLNTGSVYFSDTFIGSPNNPTFTGTGNVYINQLYPVDGYNINYSGQTIQYLNAFHGNITANSINTPTFKTSPNASASSSLALGTAYQNTLGYDVLLTVYINISNTTNANFLLGVGPTSTPTQQNILTNYNITPNSSHLVFSVPIYLPNNYYALLSTSGTVTANIIGQLAMPV